jgi:hypothetical protein
MTNVIENGGTSMCRVSVHPFPDAHQSELPADIGTIDQGVDTHAANFGAIHADIGINVDPAQVSADEPTLVELVVDAATSCTATPGRLLNLTAVALNSSLYL